jgi:hypothetical protein
MISAAFGYNLTVKFGFGLPLTRHSGIRLRHSWFHFGEVVDG